MHNAAAFAANHSTDAECAPFLPADDGTTEQVCTACGVGHGDPCADCGGRGFHTDACPQMVYPTTATARTILRRAHAVFAAASSAWLAGDIARGRALREPMSVAGSVADAEARMHWARARSYQNEAARLREAARVALATHRLAEAA